MQLSLFPLYEYIESMIRETPTGGHYDKLWWSGRYTDMQNDKRMKGLGTKLDFSFQDFFDSVLMYYSKNKTAIYFLTSDDNDL